MERSQEQEAPSQPVGMPPVRRLRNPPFVQQRLIYSAGGGSSQRLRSEHIGRGFYGWVGVGRPELQQELARALSAERSVCGGYSRQ